MPPPVRAHFDEALAHLAEAVTALGVQVSEAITRSVTALADHDVELAEAVTAQEATINAEHDAIKDTCVRLLATEQPVATDLRRILGFMSVSSNLERIGDLAMHVASVAQRLAAETYVKELISIPDMADRVAWMVVDSVQAFQDLDTTAAEQVSARDNKVDDTYSHVFRELLTYMMENPKTISQATSLLFVAKQLERCGDHTTNICESVVYVTTGKHVDLNR